MDELGYVYGIWFVPSADNDKDWTGTLYKADSDGLWHFNYRFRYYHPESEDPHDGKDEKSNYGLVAEDGLDVSRDKMIETLTQLVPIIEMQFGARCDFVKFECRNDDPKFFFELASRPWAHLQMGVRESPARPRRPWGDHD